MDSAQSTVEAENGVRNPTLTTIWQLAAALRVSTRSFFPHVEQGDRED